MKRNSDWLWRLEIILTTRRVRMTLGAVGLDHALHVAAKHWRAGELVALQRYRVSGNAAGRGERDRRTVWWVCAACRQGCHGDRDNCPSCGAPRPPYFLPVDLHPVVHQPPAAAPGVDILADGTIVWIVGEKTHKV